MAECAISVVFARQGSKWHYHEQMAIQVQKILESFPDLLVLTRGAGTHTVEDIQTGSTARPESLIFVSNPQHLKEARDTSAAAWVVSQELAASVPHQVSVVLTSPNAALAMALVAKKFFPQTRGHVIISGPKIHEAACISVTARVGAGCSVGPGAVIGDDCLIGENCIIGANSVIEPGVKIGARTHIHPLVFIGHSCEIGADCEIQPHTTIGAEGFGYAQDKQFNHYRITHYGRIVIEDRVHIGAGTQIDRGTFLDSRIGTETKIDNHCHFGHNIQIGRNTLITGGVLTAGSVTLGSYCVFGGRTTISGHLKVADHTKFGGLSGITKDVTEPGDYGGFPLQGFKEAARTRAAIRNLPKIMRQMRTVMRHLGLKDSDNGTQE